MGYCADDPGRAPLVGDEVRACWSDPGIATEPTDSETLGLFAEHPTATSSPASGPFVPVAPPAAGPDPAPATSAPAWPDGLVEAPHVEPGRQLVSELERRARGDRSG